MKKTITASIVGFLLVAYIGLSTYAISTQGIEDLLLCADRGGLKIPFSQQICRKYLFAFRGSKQDIAALHQGIGALFVTQGESPPAERDTLLKFLVKRGLDVNRAGTDQVLPLHGAVLANAADEVKLLLDNGANPALPDHSPTLRNYTGLTPLEMALKLQAEDKSPRDRSAVIALLTSATAKTQHAAPSDSSQPN